MAAAMGHQAKFATGDDSTIDEPFDFISENIALAETFIDGSGFVGSRSMPKERLAASTRSVAGQVVMNPTGADLDLWLPRILGGVESADSFPLAETLPSFYACVDRVAKVFTYSTCYVNSATFKASEGTFLEMTIDLMGTDETVGNAGTFPSLTITHSVPYIFSQLVLTIGGTEYHPKSWELTVNNALEMQFFNSLTPTRINATDREVTVTTQLPYGDATATYGVGTGGAAVVATFTSGGKSLAFSCASVAFPRNSPVVTNVRGELMIDLTGRARKSGSTAELAVTSDSTA